MAETKADLENKVAALEAKVEQLETEKAEQAAQITELSAANESLEAALAEQHAQLNEVAEKSATSSGAVTVEVKGRKYEITAKKVNFKGTNYTAEELSENKDVAAELVKIGAGILKEIV